MSAISKQKNKSSSTIHKILFKIDYNIVKLLLRDKVEVKSLQLMLSQNSTSKGDYFRADMQAGV